VEQENLEDYFLRLTNDPSLRASVSERGNLQVEEGIASRRWQ